MSAPCPVREDYTLFCATQNYDIGHLSLFIIYKNPPFLELFIQQIGLNYLNFTNLLLYDRRHC